VLDNNRKLMRKVIVTEFRFCLEAQDTPISAPWLFTQTSA
jgi:hypothetical protein